jgi:ubiquinol-cytochrome c reductase cytochrome b subunit
MIVTAFLGYILPWGQMSFRGAMVITSLLGAIPGIGSDILFLLWGSYSIENATLARFYSLHYTLPFVILAITIVHFTLLHEFGSNNVLGINTRSDNIPFIPYYGVKDVFSIIITLIIFSTFIIINPDVLGHSDNFSIANPLVTPAHIVPEWYFLPLYAILRSVTNKLLGISLIGACIVCILCPPFICKGSIIRSSLFKPLYNIIV